MSALAPTKFVLDNTMGAQLIGVLLAAGLYGISCTQTWYYYTLYSKDRISLRLLVAFVWLFDTCHQILISHTVYVYLVQNYANPAQLGNLVWSLLVEVLFNGLTALLVQSFFAWRIWCLSERNVYLASVVVALIGSEFVAVVVYTIMALQLKTFAELATLKHLSMIVNVLAAAGDVLIAFVLCIILYTQKTGFKASDSMINRLMLFAVNTGLLTSICAVMSLVSIVVWPMAFIYICFYFMLGRLYSNSLLATLNARNSIRGMHTDTDGFSLSIPDLPNTTSFAFRSKRSPKPKSSRTLSVKVETTHEYASDPVRTGKILFPGKATLNGKGRKDRFSGADVSMPEFGNKRQVETMTVITDGAENFIEPVLDRASADSKRTIGDRDINEVEAQHSYAELMPRRF